MRETAGGGTPGDDTARFLRELRQLRDYAGLGPAELAARAHYPHDHIRAAEIGPAVPDLPVLAAYVRGCGGTVEEWEERWRKLTNTPALSLLPTRSAGRSIAATAGARVGSVSPAADVPDPGAIIAALDRVAEMMAASSPPSSRSSGSLPPPIGQPSLASSSRSPAAAPAAGPSVTAGATNAPPPVSAGTRHAARSRRFSMTSRATITALIALAICVIVAVLAVFA